MHTVTKRYQDLPAAHRQPNHKGHCRLIHGHNWAFDITFGCEHLDECGFVIDLGDLQAVKEWIEATFDHTLLLNEDDPMLESIKLVRVLEIRLVPNCGMEGLAEFVFKAINDGFLKTQFHLRNKGLHVVSVTCWEDSKNRATYTPTE